MTTHRFFVDPGSTAGDRFPLPASIVHQVTRVLRLGDGAEIVLLEGDGLEIRCRLEGDALVVLDRAPSAGEPRHRLTVAQALLKGDHLEPVIRHGTEVGISRFELFVAQRSVARDLSPARLTRLRAVAREAAEQSERGLIPEVVGPLTLTDVIGPGSVLLFERDTAAPRLSTVPTPDRVVIGPEGGFTQTEVAAAKASGVVLASLGPRILRSESAAMVAAAVVLSETGDFA